MKSVKNNITTQKNLLQALKRHRASPREMPWRSAEPNGAFDPYKILVSEIMLQQTQVVRVVPKFLAFIEAFPTLQSLAKASLEDVLILWSGLGYNRRAKYLHDASKQLIKKSGDDKWAYDSLMECKGIGENTAKAVLVYAYNVPEVFIETNIRTVFIHHFFPDAEKVHDNAIREQLEKVIDVKEPRQFYWALMDYGVELKVLHGNSSRQSSGYVKQSKFEGSDRQIRGAVLRELTLGARSMQKIRMKLPDKRTEGVVLKLINEGLLVRENNNVRLPN